MKQSGTWLRFILGRTCFSLSLLFFPFVFLELLLFCFVFLYSMSLHELIFFGFFVSWICVRIFSLAQFLPHPVTVTWSNRKHDRSQCFSVVLSVWPLQNQSGSSFVCAIISRYNHVYILSCKHASRQSERAYYLRYFINKIRQTFTSLHCTVIPIVWVPCDYSCSAG